MAKNEVKVCKIFSFDSAHQLVNHKGKCANVHGHTYKLEVNLKAEPIFTKGSTDEGFVIDFSDLKMIVKEEVLNEFDHAFIAQGNEPSYEIIKNSGSKVCLLGFRTTVENMASYICWKLIKRNLSVYSVKLWETPTGWAEVLSEDIPEKGPLFLLKTSGALNE